MSELTALDELIQSAIDEAQDQQSAVWLDLADRARAELSVLRAEVEQWQNNCRRLCRANDTLRADRKVLNATGDELRATIKAQAAQIEAMDLERGELMLARDYARDEA